jgi:hypothetical protein
MGVNSAATRGEIDMNYKTYGTKKSTPQRMTRKRMRVTVFVTNSKMARIRRKERRIARQAIEQGE